MSFRFHAPSENLQPFIQGYLEADYRNTYEKGEHTLFPNGYSGIFFNFGNPGKLIINEEIKTPSVSVFGQIDRHFVAIHYPGYYSLGVLLKPTVLSWYLKVNMAELTNKATDGQLLTNDFSILHNQMEEALSFTHKIQLFEKHFIQAISNKQFKVTIADEALSMIGQYETISVQQIASHLGVSQRHLETQFKNSVGLSPKAYLMILRFKRMELQMKKLSMIHWPDMSFASEYYDQNHFIKDFKRFTGLTPTIYLEQNLEMGRSYLTTK